MDDNTKEILEENDLFIKQIPEVERSPRVRVAHVFCLVDCFLDAV